MRNASGGDAALSRLDAGHKQLDARFAIGFSRIPSAIDGASQRSAEYHSRERIYRRGKVKIAHQPAALALRQISDKPGAHRFDYLAHNLFGERGFGGLRHHRSNELEMLDGSFFVRFG